MPMIPTQLRDLLQYFSVHNSSNHIISLALTNANDSFVMGFKQQAMAFDQLSWDLLKADNTSLLNNDIVNSSYVPYATNDTLANRTKVAVKPRISTEIPIWLIPCYSIILIFAIVGNLLVASTLFQNRRMRTITNVFLANLAISDMLLGVLCMPITLVGTYLRHFIFGELVCKFIQFAQAASVAVSSWTLVAISCERYYAICHPLRSRTWQTINHAYKIIGCIWFGSIICMSPIAIFSQLIPTSRQGLRKCREQWPEEAVGCERFYNIFLDLALLVLPLVILCVAYILITRTLYMGIKDEKALIFGSKNNNTTNNCSASIRRDDTKIYTQVKAEMKKPTIFHLHTSFRYHTRKGASNGRLEPKFILDTATKNGREIKYFRNVEVENKYSAMDSMPPFETETVCNRRELRYSSSENVQAEKEISFGKTKEQNNYLQTSSSLGQHCSDDLTLNNVRNLEGVDFAPPTFSVRTKQNDGRKRSASVKSLTRDRTNSKKNRSISASASGLSINTMATTKLTRIQNRQHLEENHNNQPSTQLMEFHQQQPTIDSHEKRKLNSAASLRITELALRRSNIKKNLESKKRVVKMLFVLVLEFFICWTPLYVINTVAMFIGPAIYEYVNYTTISFFQLLAYSSSCCNPITYCFMNASFRRAFVDTFRGMHLKDGKFWHKSSKTATNLSVAGNSIALANSCTVMSANTVFDSPRL